MTCPDFGRSMKTIENQMYCNCNRLIGRKYFNGFIRFNATRAMNIAVSISVVVVVVAVVEIKLFTILYTIVCNPFHMHT